MSNRGRYLCSLVRASPTRGGESVEKEIEAFAKVKEGWASGEARGSEDRGMYSQRQNSSFGLLGKTSAPLERTDSTTNTN